MVSSSTNKEGTFFYDEKLPPLPVPPVNQTIAKYLDSCRAILSPTEYSNTVKICDEFIKKDAAKLQELLQKRGEERKNWLEEWWNDKGYLETRDPLFNVYFGGPAEYREYGWDVRSGTQVERISYGLYIFMQLWKEVSEETLKVHKGYDGTIFSMKQFRFLYNTCRIPQRGKDRVHHGFKTKAEGGSATYAVVICNGYFFRLETINKQTGEIYTPPHFERVVRQIKNICESRPPAPGVCTLTYLDRDSWSDARNHLIDISEINRENIALVEDALVHLCVDPINTDDFSVITKSTIACEPGLVWADKSFSYHTTENGVVLATCDHTPYDAMVMVMLVQYTCEWLKKYGTVWNGTTEIENTEEHPVELVFEIDDKIRSYLHEGEQIMRQFSDNIEVHYVPLTDFGKSALKRYKIHPDFFVQICIQLAYIRQMNKPAPTYETATTRQYYNGRTETCRTCTPEAVEFCQAMIDGHTNAVSLLMKANDKFVWLMNQCKDGYGCDRHLMGLAMIALENNLPLPPIFTDPSYVKTGGNGNYVLSTSCTGYLNITGAVTPMRKDGYGCFYRINNDKFVYCLSAWKYNPLTNASQMVSLINRSFQDVYELLKSSKSKL